MIWSRVRFKELLPMIILHKETIDHQQYITLVTLKYANKIFGNEYIMQQNCVLKL